MKRKFAEARGARIRRAKARAARKVEALWNKLEVGPTRRQRLFEQDAAGRTLLFYAAEAGLEEVVEEMIYCLRGTGLAPTRLALIATKDKSGLTAADLAEQNGHTQVARLLRGEQARMEYYE